MTIRGANAEVVSGSEILRKGKGFLEVAQEHAESSRAELLDETTRLRRLTLMTTNRLQSMIHGIRTLASIKSEELASLDHDAPFPLTPINAADDKLLSLFASANDALATLSSHLSERSSIPRESTSEPTKASESAERERLQVIIDKLRTELGMSCLCPSPDLSLTLLHLLDEAKKLHERHAAETCVLLSQVATQCVPRIAVDVSVDLMTAPERDAERDRLNRIKKVMGEAWERGSDVVYVS
ncbi:hypothetical protein PAXRUDRAFT_19156 [Paxillus rubicundulus Ve08.2h10]|uniref:Uncharacterized protein n=1 Tax=Paxillus rubicundulus Ve08.2h10 TaxID=930991 RepID=A0A0D0BUZ8_9AGAM|nr:hypothetical protein PAXRUDRAFT_19156 [Paxillus rubicundulus Ve08.2h10]